MLAKAPARKPPTLGRTGCSRARACAPCRRHPRAHRRSASGSAADERGRQKLESDIRDNPAMSRFEVPLGDDALAVAYYNVEDGRVVLLHTEVPQELAGQGFRIAAGAWRFRSVATRP